MKTRKELLIDTELLDWLKEKARKDHISVSCLIRKYLWAQKMIADNNKIKEKS